MKRQSVPKPRERYSARNDSALDHAVQQQHQVCPTAGQEEIRARLRCEGLMVNQQRVRQSLQRVDSLGTASRWASVIQRREYAVKSPNSLWHLDTNHALRR